MSLKLRTAMKNDCVRLLPDNVRNQVILLVAINKEGQLIKAVNGVPIADHQLANLIKMFNAGDSVINRKLELLNIAGQGVDVYKTGKMLSGLLYKVELNRDEYQQLKKEIR